MQLQILLEGTFLWDISASVSFSAGEFQLQIGRHLLAVLVSARSLAVPKQERAARSNLVSALPADVAPGCARMRKRKTQQQQKAVKVELVRISTRLISHRDERLHISEIHSGDARNAAHEGISSTSCMPAQLNSLRTSSPGKMHPGH